MKLLICLLVEKSLFHLECVPNVFNGWNGLVLRFISEKSVSVVHKFFDGVYWGLIIFKYVLLVIIRECK